MMYIVIFAGSRYASGLTHMSLVGQEVGRFHYIYGDELFIRVGDARGTDAFVRYYCRMLDIKYREYVADWNKYGIAAGPVRNKKMVDDGADEGFLFFKSDMESRGTSSTQRLLSKAGIPYTIKSI